METTAAAASNGVPRQKLSFAYDHQSRRISKLVSDWNASSNQYQVTSNLLFAYDGWNLLAELSALTASPLPLRTYAWGLDLSGTEQGAGGIGGLLWMTSHQLPLTSHFYSFDGNGNVTALLNVVTGQRSAEYEYGPFGEVLRRTGSVANENVLCFGTKYTDTESGLLYFGYRYFQTTTGRWLSSDPVQERGGFNLYSSGNDFVSLTDLLGLEPANSSGANNVVNRPADTITTTIYNPYKQGEELGAIKLSIKISILSRNLSKDLTAAYLVQIVIGRPTTDTDNYRAVSRKALRAWMDAERDHREISDPGFQENVNFGRSHDLNRAGDDWGIVHVRDSSRLVTAPSSVTGNQPSDKIDVASKINPWQKVTGSVEGLAEAVELKVPVTVPLQRCPNNGTSDVWVFYGCLDWFKNRAWAHYRFQWRYTEGDGKRAFSVVNNADGIQQLQDDLAVPGDIWTDKDR